MTFVRTLVVLAAFAAAPAALAQVVVADPWVRGVVPAQSSTGAFMQLTSPTDTTLVSVSSPAAKVVELHQMSMDGGVMRMAAVKRLALPAGKTVTLGPDGYHVMLMGFTAPLKEGDSVPLKLTFEDAAGKRTTIDVKAPVRSLTAPAHKH